ncbi:PhoPQ-activated protein PqaA family protein [Sphingopyxis granuli]|uniref:PhoPQ-activated protein PqaA family protein n=1 Tax=Sphingopyxis granuli TaxID=267128 RepID=UPI001BAF54CB|nr:PhoPQ-activated protein PqaA family protein [Sphingopyxis granuli]QUM73982.1 alpha/beta hydrolase [Sphingopyxis granuli]
MAKDYQKPSTTPILIAFTEAQQSRETYGGGVANVVLQGMHLRRPDATRDTVLVFMHPTATLDTLPLPRELARRGVPVLACGSRYPHNDSALIMEKVLVDLGHYVRYARERLGYRTVILAGWSGGASLSVFYQSQAQNPTITATPCGHAIDLSGLQPADAIMQLAAHSARARIMTESMDASLRSEGDPTDRNAAFDLYDRITGPKPPYAPDFVAAYRAAQIDRNQRITAWVRETLDALKRRGSADQERCFVTHGTMADPRWLDPTLDANGRAPGICYLGEPEAVNNGPIGLARFATLRSWLSQWSIDESRANTELQGPHVTVPALVIANAADDCCPPSHTDTIYRSLGGPKELHTIPGANHYYIGQREQLDAAITLIIDWLRKGGLLEGLPDASGGG